MEFTSIPNLSFKASRLALGTWSMGGWMWGGTEEKQSIETILKALDLGINVIDTAPVYGFGLSEKMVGKALKQYGKRDQIVLVTKVGLSWKSNKQVYRDCRKEVIKKEIEASLKRLQVEYIDLYLVHWPDPITPFSETAEVLKDLLQEGKIRAMGVSNFSLEQMQTFQESGPLHALQSPFNLFECEIEQKELRYCIDHHIATMGYGALCRGLLTGKIDKNTQFKGDDLRKTDPKFQDPAFSQYLACIEKLKKWVTEKYQRPLLSLALRWILDKKISIALWGARKPEQLQGIKQIEGWHLSQQDFEEMDRIIQETILSPTGPGFIAPPTRY